MLGTFQTKTVLSALITLRTHIPSALMNTIQRTNIATPAAALHDMAVKDHDIVHP